MPGRNLAGCRLDAAVSDDDPVPFHVTTLEVALVAAGLVFLAAMLTLRQKTRHDRREAWWQRAQWAIDRSLSDDDRTRTVGTKAMIVLAADRTAPSSDLDVLDAAVVVALDRS